MDSPPIIVWMRRGLRLADNPALHAASEQGHPVIPLYVWRQECGMGAASRAWLLASLDSLRASFERVGSRLLLRTGAPESILPSVAHECGARAIYWNREYEPEERRCEEAVRDACAEANIEQHSFSGDVLREPWELATSSGKPYQVFTAYASANARMGHPGDPLPPPRKLISPAVWPVSDSLESLDLKPSHTWPGALLAHWRPGEEGALGQLTAFLDECHRDYGAQRDLPAIAGTSRLSPHLAHGEISVRGIWRAVRERMSAALSPFGDPFLRQILWRDFAHYLLFYFPHTINQPLRTAFTTFPWCEDEAAFRAWRLGRTGFPIVDAGMRELWSTGWMHNRVRMITASFLTKDLLLPWMDGAAWFHDTLVDADLANNTMGWQWTAGCGADAAPYFRVFNPVLQGARFDPQGEYIRAWIPELADVPAKYIHAPWKTSGGPPREYPPPMVDHAVARRCALEAYGVIKGAGEADTQ